MKRFILILAATATLMAGGLTCSSSTSEARDWARPGPARYYTGFGRNYGPYNRPYYYRPYYYGYRSYGYPYYYGYRGDYIGGPRAGVYYRY